MSHLFASLLSYSTDVSLGQFEIKYHVLCLGLYLKEVFNIRLTVADEDLKKWQKRELLPDIANMCSLS